MNTEATSSERDSGLTHAYHVHVSNVWGQRWEDIAASPGVGQALADVKVEEMVESMEGTEKPDYSEWSKSTFEPDKWRPKTPCENWEIRVQEYDVKTEPPAEQVGKSLRPHYTYKDGPSLVLLLDGERMQKHDAFDSGVWVTNHDFRDGDVLYVAIDIAGGPSLNVQHLDSEMTGEKEIDIDLAVERDTEGVTVYTPVNDGYDFKLELVRIETEDA